MPLQDLNYKDICIVRTCILIGLAALNVDGDVDSHLRKKSSCMEKWVFFNCLIHATSKLRIFAAQQIRFQLRLLLYYDTIISGDDLFHFNKGLKSLC